MKYKEELWGLHRHNQPFERGGGGLTRFFNQNILGTNIILCNKTC